ncbi:hypothetical protein [Mangrovicoccus ximenensis]|uniref:hypothetical protein n=1 Tax=Mangrovicoccus ximenensis TaxID=1911570 RepID=UPI002ED53456
MLAGTGRPRLGRPVFDLLREGPIRKTYERLRATGTHDDDAELLVATTGCARALSAHIRLIRKDLGMTHDSPGYVLTLRDVTAELSAHRDRERLLHDLVERLRRPAGRLKALIEVETDRAGTGLPADIRRGAVELTDEVQAAVDAYDANWRSWWPLREVLDGGAAVDAQGAVAVSALGNADSAAEADGSATTGSGTSIGAAVALNFGTGTILASLGDADVTGDGVAVTAGMFDNDGDDTHEFAAKAKSGASGGDLSIAGSFVLSLPRVETRAWLSDDATVASRDGTADGDSDIGAVEIKAVSEIESKVEAVAEQEAGEASEEEEGEEGGGDTVGVGASIAVHYADMDTIAEILGGASIGSTGVPGAGDVTVSAESTHEMETTVEGGTEGGTAVAPVVAVVVAENDVHARIPFGANALEIAGDLSVEAELEAATVTLAKGAAKGESIGVGVAIGVNVVFDTVGALIARDVVAGGAVAVLATGVTLSRTDARASSAGAKKEGDEGTGEGEEENAQAQTDQRVGEANDRSGRTGTDGEAASPEASTSSGNVSVAAAIAVNIETTEVIATLAAVDGNPDLTITAGGAVSVKTAANADANAFADGSAVTFDDGTAVGAALAINVSTLRNLATLDRAEVEGDGVTVEAGMAEREIGFEVSELKTVDVEANTIFVGSPEDAFEDGETVTYQNGGNPDIEGLTHDEEYIVRVGENGLIQLEKDGDIVDFDDDQDLSAKGTGHVLDRTDKENVTFDPDESRFEIDFEEPGGLVTGAKVTYDKGDGSNDPFAPLASGTDYFVVVEGDGKLALAETREKALNGETITLENVGSGDGHALKESDHATGAVARSGAGGGDVGVAGSVALNFAFDDSFATIGDAAAITVTGTGASAVNAASTSYSIAKAVPKTDTGGKSLGLGLSFGINIQDRDAIATLAGGAEVAGAADLSVTAAGDHATVALAQAGSVTEAEDGTVVSGALALAVTLNETRALAEGGDGGALGVDGDLVIRAVHGQEAYLKSDADTKGGKTGVGIALSMGWVEDDTSALLARDVSVTGDTADDVTVEAESTIAALSYVSGSSEGSKNQESEGDGTTADEQTAANADHASSQSGADLSDPQPGAEIAGANDEAASQTGNPGGQGGTGEDASTQTSGGSLRVAGAIGAMVIKPDVSAMVADGVTLRATGAMSVKAGSQADSAIEATGLALDTSTGKTGVAAAVGVNVAILDTTALIGAGADVETGSLAVKAGTPDGEQSDFKVLALAGAGVNQKSNSSQEGDTDTNGGLAIAGAAGVNVVLVTTEAGIGADASVTAASGDATVAAQDVYGLQNIAGGGAIALNGDSTSVGAAIAVNVMESDTASGIGAGATVEAAAGSVAVTADLEVKPLEIVAPVLGETGIDVTALAVGASVGAGGGSRSGRFRHRHRRGRGLRDFRGRIAATLPCELQEQLG